MRICLFEKLLEDVALGFRTCKVKTSKPYVVSIFLRYLG